MEGITELQCDIHGTTVTVQKRMEEHKRGAWMEPYQVRVYDIYVGNTLVYKGLGEPFAPLSAFWLKGKM
jgi:hypothetical protein